MKMLTIGKMRHRVRVETPTFATDSFGGQTQTFALLRRTWAHIEPLRDREYLEAQQIRGDITHKITMRRVKNMTPKCQIVHGSRTFHIVSVVNPDEQDRFHKVMAKEEV